MCGPLCISLSQRGSLWPYHLGRALSYTILGAVAGMAGQYLLWHTNPWVKTLSLLFFALGFLWFTVEIFRSRTTPLASAFWQKILRLQTQSRFALGALSVFLPCGWLFYFVLAAGATQSAWTGALVLFLFWLSGLPALAGSTLFMKKAMQKAHPSKRRFAVLWLTLAGFYALFAHYLFH